jgi:uncharacterized membrane protein
MECGAAHFAQLWEVIFTIQRFKYFAICNSNFHSHLFSRPERFVAPFELLLTSDRRACLKGTTLVCWNTFLLISRVARFHLPFHQF